jgi:glyoxylase-like metal-dependent hydrolase (beta-lactamase superfamily II)
MVISFQAFVIKAGERRIMLDTCLGNGRTRQFEVFNNLQTSFLDDIASVGCPAESIDTVVCTHLHFDHTGWNTRWDGSAWAPTFPNARYLMVKEEYEDLKHAMVTGAHYTGHVPDSVKPILDAGLVDFVENDHRVTGEMWLFPTPGHTAGHCSLHISSKGEEAVLTGDLMHHPIQCAEPDWLAACDGDKELAAKTRRAFLEKYGDGHSLVIGGHFAEPTAGCVRRDGASWRFSVEQPSRAKVEA